MIRARWQRNALVAALAAATSAVAQQPFDLDVSFRTSIDENYVNSIYSLPDGRLLVSGRIKFPGDQIYRFGARLMHDGTRDTSYEEYPGMGGRITPWNGLFYSGSGAVVRRVNMDGGLDQSFNMIGVPYFISNQGGDYHVFPDGRVLLTGAHSLNDTVRGFTGTYHFIWFTNTGTLDTARIHRRCGGNSAIYDIEPLSDGKFLLSGVLSTYEGSPVGRIFRVHPDGALDPTFQTSIHWGQAVGYHQQADGKVIAAGRFLFQGDPDTLHLVRLMPDGQLDTTFNNHLRSLYTNSFGNSGFYPWGGARAIDDGRLVVFGAFTSIDEQPRGGIALVDTTGQLLDGPFGEGGCGQFLFNGTDLNGSIEGITEAPDGSFYTWGSYHGYDDGTTNDPTQRMVSRLYGLNVGVQEQQKLQWRVYPNPASKQITVEFEQVLPGNVLLLCDALGREVRRQNVMGYTNSVDLQGLGSGLYLLEVLDHGRRRGAERVVVE